MGMLVQGRYGFFIRRLYKTKNIIPFFVYPIGHAFALMLILQKNIFLMSFGNILRLNARDNMNIHEKGHNAEF
jgi:hypothetical protein